MPEGENLDLEGQGNQGDAGSQQGQQQSQSFAIPEAYAEKGWAKNITSIDDLWKNHENAQTLIGKKQVPDFANATEHEINDFYDKLRPSDKAYSFPEGTTDAEKQIYTDLLYNNGISKHQASKLVEGLQAQTNAIKAEMFSDKGLEENWKKSFGDDYKEIAGKTAKLLNVHLNESDRKILETIPNDHVGLIYRLANNFAKAYGASESGSAGQANAGGSQNIEETRTAIRTKLSELQKGFHTEADKKVLLDKLSATYRK